MPDASSTHSHTTLVHITAYRAPAIRGYPARARTTNDGSTHTRWCTQVMGLTRQAARPVSAKAAVQSPAATALRVRHPHTASVSRTTVAHSGLSG